LPHYLVKVKCSTVQRYIHVMYAVLAGLICGQATNERIAVRDSFPVILLLKPCYER